MLNKVEEESLERWETKIQRGIFGRMFFQKWVGKKNKIEVDAIVQ